jgi:hypothetical protein
MSEMKIEVERYGTSGACYRFGYGWEYRWFTEEDWKLMGLPEMKDREKRTYRLVADGVCEWRPDTEEPAKWHSGCEKRYFFSLGSPSRNKWKGCPFCMKPIREVQG